MERILREFSRQPVRALVVWEPVLLTDWAAPSTATLDRISDLGASQFWDRRRLISRSLGEHNRRTIVWDYVAVYGAGTLWTDQPPPPLYKGGPVVRVMNRCVRRLHKLQRRRRGFASRNTVHLMILIRLEQSIRRVRWCWRGRSG